MFITTTLPYCNGPIHVGAAFEFVIADFLNRYLNSNGIKSYLNIGLDQTGQKILAKSKELNKDVDIYISEISKEWIESVGKLDVKCDNFYQTHTNEHKSGVINIWNKLLISGDIYEKNYVGKYCVGCESFKLDKDLINNKCPDHSNQVIQIVSEKNYFFNLGKYKNNITEWLKSDPISDSDKNELLKYIDEYDEFSISRKKSDKTFDIDVPGDDQVIGVWFSALLNYIFVCNDWDKTYTLQICGKDNIRFQCQIFQCILASLNKKNTDKVLIHGTILDEQGRKMSKTLGNVVDPVSEIEKYGTDAVRYYLLSGISTFGNSKWDSNEIVTNFNNHIVNDFGNLITRTLHLIDMKGISTIKPSKEFKSNVDNQLQLIHNNITTKYNIHEYCRKLNQLVKSGNHYINEKEPWRLGDPTETLSNLYYLLKSVSPFYYPIIPSKRSSIEDALTKKKKEIIFNKIV
jgi:methionyl-tRNA synthetase